MLSEDDTPKNNLINEEEEEEAIMDVGAKIIGEGVETIRKSAKQLLQLTWDNIHIYTVPI